MKFFFGIILCVLLFLSIRLSSQELSLIFPKYSQTVDSTILFNWNIKTNSNSYRIIIDDDINFSSPIINQEVKSNFRKLSLPLGAYFWKVISENKTTTNDTSDLGAFNIFYPNLISGLSAWFKADSANVLQNGNVNRWFDLSDSSKIVNQTNSSNQPQLIKDQLNKFPVLYFNSVNDNFSIPTDTIKSSYLISCVYNTNESSFGGIRMLSGTNNWFFGPYFSIHRAFGGLFTPGDSVILGKYVTHTLRTIDDTMKNFVNSQFFGEVISPRTPGDNWLLGRRLNGNIAELIIVNDFVSDSLRLINDSYLMDKYAPPVNLGADRTLCSFPDSISLDIDYALDYTWSTGDTTDAIQIDSAGKYYVTITDMFERTSVDSMWYILDTNDFQVDFGFTDSTICLGDSITLSAGPERYSYQWNTGDTTTSIIAKNARKYKVTLKNCLGNFSSDSILLSINNPSFDLGSDTTACFNEALQLQPDSNFTSVSYQWSTGSTAASIIADSSRNYTLEVIDDFGCSFIDSILVTIDSSLFEATLGPDTSLCQGNTIGLNQEASSITSYLWSTGNTSPTQVIDTAGLYTVEFSDGNCSAADSIQISIQGQAPTANYSASNFCFQDAVQFNDSSTTQTGDTIVSWLWDFKDGQTASIANPSHVFSQVESFRIELRVTTDKNCTDTTSQLITIAPKPVANFGIDNDVACSKDPIQFTDNSSIQFGNISSYFWKFNDAQNPGDTSLEAEPAYIFDTLGTYSIDLVVQSNEGCSDTVTKAKTINPTPAVKFDYDGSCLNDSTYFSDATILPAGNIADYLWATNGQISLKENPVFKYLSGGGKPVALRVRTSAGCQSTFRDTITLFENPIADFSTSIACLGDTFQLFDQSTSVDPIVSYDYQFNNQSSTSKNPTFIANNLGSFNVKLKVTSANSCEDSILKLIQVNEAPEAAFTILNNNTGIPFQVALNNNSLRALSFRWNFGNGDFSTAEIPDYTYQDTGAYDLKLVASSIAGCKDSLTKKVVALPRFLDALLERIILEENSNGELGIAAQIINLGNNSINSLKLSVDLNNRYQSIESFDETIFRGGSTILTFSNQFLVDEGQKLDFVCVKIEEVNGVEDDVIINNSACEKGFNNEVVLNAYPNPTSETLILEYVLPQQGELKINVYDQLGRRVLDEISTQADEGFYQSRLNVINLMPGIYYYNFSINGEEFNGAFLKR